MGAPCAVWARGGLPPLGLGGPRPAPALICLAGTRALGSLEQPVRPAGSLHRGTTRLFLTVPSPGCRAATVRLQHPSLLSGSRADRVTRPDTGLVSRPCSDGMFLPHNENTRAFVRWASGKPPSSCICPLIYTLQKQPDPQESDRVCKRWVGRAPSPNPCLLLILRNNRGCSHLPKTPSPEMEGGKAASWRNKAETPVFQKHRWRQARRGCRPICPADGWFGAVTSLGGKPTPQEKLPLVLIIPIPSQFSHFPLSLVRLLSEGRKGSSISVGIFLPPLLSLPF